MTAGPTIDYEALAQEAMRGLVRTVLTRTAKSGLPGDHHFYISFDTESPGVILSKRLKEKYPREMTIVLQHRFWDLAVTDERFEVKLTFDGIPERLVVPFAAIKVFFDPSVRYGLQFEEPDLGPDSSLASGVDGEPRSARQPRRPRATKKPRIADRNGAEAAEPSTLPGKGTSSPPMPPVSKSQKNTPPATLDAELPTAPAGNGGGAEIVSLDQFRKK